MRKRFGDLKIGAKLTGGFLLVTVIAGIIGAIGIFSLIKVGGAYHVAYENSVAALQHMEKIATSFQEIRVSLFEMTLAEDRAYKEKCIENIQEQRRVIDENLTGYKAELENYSDEDAAMEQKLLSDLETAILGFAEKRMDFMNGLGMDNTRRAEAFLALSDGGELQALAQSMEDAIESLLDYNNEYALAQIETNDKMASRSEMIMLVVLLGGIVTSVIIGMFMARDMSERIGVIVGAMGRLSEGELDVSIDVNSKDEIGILAQASRAMATTLQTVISDLSRSLDAFADGNFALDTLVADSYVGNYRPLLDAIRATRDTLSETLRAINESAEQVAIGSDQVSGGAQALASGASQQAAAVEELTASVEGIADQSNENLVIVEAASRSVQQAGTDAEAGNRQMEQLTLAMADIGSASDQIANITKVIEDIAFQTNILRSTPLLKRLVPVMPARVSRW